MVLYISLSFALQGNTFGLIRFDWSEYDHYTALRFYIDIRCGKQNDDGQGQIGASLIDGVNLPLEIIVESLTTLIGLSPAPSC